MTSGPKDAATSDSTSWPRADSPRSTPTPRKRGHDTRRTHRIECNNRSPGDVFIHHHPGLGHPPAVLPEPAAERAASETHSLGPTDSAKGWVEFVPLPDQSRQRVAVDAPQ